MVIFPTLRLMIMTMMIIKIMMIMIIMIVIIIIVIMKTKSFKWWLPLIRDPLPPAPLANELPLHAILMMMTMIAMMMTIMMIMENDNIRMISVMVTNVVI